MVSTKEFLKLCYKGHHQQALQPVFLAKLYSDPILFFHLLRGCRFPRQSLHQAHQLHAFIITSGASSHRFTSNHQLHTYSKLGHLRTALAVSSRMPRKNIMSSNILIGGFMRHDNLNPARKVFDEMPERIQATWNAMATGLTRFGFDQEGLYVFATIRGAGFGPDQFGLASALRCSAGLGDLGSGWRMHSYIIHSGFEYDMCMGSSLAHGYMKGGCLEEGERVLKAMPGDSKGALAHFSLKRAAGLAPDVVTSVGGVTCSCSDLASFGQGQQVHAQGIKAGADSAVPVRSSLVSMYSRCLQDSAQVFYESAGVVECNDCRLWVPWT